MCGRFTLTQPASIAAKFELDNFAPTEPEFYEPHFNVAPTQRIVVIPTVDGQRQARRMRWGLVPYWAKDIKIGASLINARAEGIESKPAFRAAFKSRRCLIPADGFYEWQSGPRGKQPYRVTLADGAMFAFAGLWERWRNPATDDWIESCCIVTCDTNELTAKFHDRMPVIIAAEDYDTWLTGTPEQALTLLNPYPAEEMRAYPVSSLVNSPRNDTAELVTEVREQTGDADREPDASGPPEPAES
jgi:putative SOS response-associated peptidase YedK